MGMVEQGLGWTAIAYSSVSTKHPVVSNQNPCIACIKKPIGTEKNPNERNSPDFLLTVNTSEQYECCYSLCEL